MSLFGWDFDWKNPDYGTVVEQRLDRLRYWERHPKDFAAAVAFYRDNPGDFITDWGTTYDPRNLDLGLSPNIPFILYPKQIEWINYVLRKWRGRERGLTEKSRELGVSWLAVSLSCALCLFNDGMAIGFGSRKKDLVDRIGNPDSLFWKARFFMEMLPAEFRGSWEQGRHAPEMLIQFPDSGSSMIGEAGDNIGRGGRTGIYFVDETAFIEHQNLVEGSLSQTTNCRIDISTPNGLGNPFEQNAHSGKIEVFTFHWRDDPRKDEAWYQAQKANLSPIVVAQEIDLDYAASVERVIIPHAWVMAAIEAHDKLHITPTGEAFGAFDVADEGTDTNSFCGAHGILIDYLEEWHGKGSDIFASTERVFMLCDDLGYRKFRYDGDGMGADVRGNARVINERRQQKRELSVFAERFRGSEKPVFPERQDVPGRKNKDFFFNHKAQSWWSLRKRFERTFLWVEQGQACDPDQIISLSKDLPNLMKLASELSQPTYIINGVGKMLVDKMPDGSKSPNLADGVMMRFAPSHGIIRVGQSALEWASIRTR